MKICATSFLLKNVLLHEKKPDIGNGVEHSAQIFCAECSTEEPSTQYFRSIIQRNYHIFDTCRPRPPCLGHGFPVPFFQNTRGARSIRFYTGGSSHKCPSLFGELQHQKALQFLAIAVSALPGIVAFDESAALQRVECGSSSLIDQLAQVQFRV